MHSFQFNLPTRIIFGPGSLKKLQRNLKGLGKKALIVIGQGSVKKHGTLDRVLAQLHEISVEPIIFEGIEPNPHTATIDKAAKLTRKEKPRYVIALGGGSVMDAAKCIAMLAVNPGSVWDYAYQGIHVERKKFQKALPLVCIPTVAGTGSEADCYAVVSNTETQKKCTVLGNSLFPVLAIVDPELTCTVPRQPTIDGAIDIITHVLEDYLSTNDNTPLQDRFSLSIVKTVMESLDELLSGFQNSKLRTQNLELRTNLSWCSTIALSGFLSGRDGGWPIHAIEHALSAHTDISHGRGLAMLLPAIMRFDLEANTQKIAAMRTFLFLDLPKGHFARFRGNNKEAAAATIETFQNWLHTIGADYKLRDTGISKQDFGKIAEDVILLNGNIHGNLTNIRPMGKEDILQILEEIF